MWLSREKPEPPALKAWFREMDKDRNGMIDEQELGALLRRGGDKDITDSSVHAIWKELDKNGDGHILFDEFVDFIFSPPDKNTGRLMRPKPKRKLHRLDTEAIDVMKVAAAGETLVPKVEVFGATLSVELNGRYRACGKDWVVDKQGHSCPSSGEEGVLLNGKAVFEGQDTAHHRMFYGHLRGGRRQGWFIAESEPDEGQPVNEWLAFNPSPLANLPDLCYSSWEIRAAGGRRDKRMVCEATYIMMKRSSLEAKSSMDSQNLRGGWDRIHGGMSACQEDELWDILDSDESSDEDGPVGEEEEPDDEELWEQGWGDQEGEDCGCGESSGEDSDAYVSALQARLAEKRGRTLQQSGSQMWREYVQGKEGYEEAWDTVGQMTGEASIGVSEISETWGDGRESCTSLGSRSGDVTPWVRGGATRESIMSLQRRDTRTSLMSKASRPSVTSSASGRSSHRVSTGFHVHTPGFHEVQSEGSQGSQARPKRITKRRTKPKIFAEASEEAKKKESLKKRGDEDDDDPYGRLEEDGFLDREFPPIEASLGKTSADSDGWTRLPSLHKNSILFAKVVPDDVMADDAAGNLWFLSACAAVAEYPAWIKTIFGRRAHLTRKHMYKVRLYHPGKKKFTRIVIDDYVPTLSQKAPTFAGLSVGGEAWVALLEKAFAKLCGSFANTEWGDTAYGLLYLCGGGGAEKWERANKGGLSIWKRSTTLWKGQSEDRIERENAEGFVMDGAKRDEDAIWKMVRKYMKFCYPVTCGVQSNMKQLCGLEDDRCYSLIRTCEIPAGPGTCLRMMMLRNPWGIGEWEGRWSDSSTTWTENPYAAEFVNLRAEQDGTFWMAYSDFLEYFSTIYTVKKSMPIQGCNRHKHQELKRGLMHYQE